MRKRNRKVVSLGSQLRHIRESKALSVRALAELAGGITPSAITRIENDTREPTLRSLQAFARGLNLSIGITPSGLFVTENEEDE